MEVLDIFGGEGWDVVFSFLDCFFVFKIEFGCGVGNFFLR